MPLVVPGIMSNDGGDDWMSKLAGKKIGEQHDEMVRRPRAQRESADNVMVIDDSFVTTDLRQDRPPQRTPHPQAR
jgi:hypothetical protein